ncbi:MAG: serine/threonine-protein kinase [Pirellulales bacterium]
MTSASRDKHTPNDSFSSHRLVRRIATSQSYEIWEAQHTRTRRSHAVKVMLPSLRARSAQIANLRHEFTVGKSLSHDSVIRTDEFGIEDGVAYLVMEYCPAPNMKQWSRQEGNQLVGGCLSEIVDDAADALGYFHDRGWVHRDVKPENFLVCEQGSVKLIDFSIARRERGWFGRLFDRCSKRQGTMSYMSPEQIRNKPHDKRSDIYSFGCLIYELICGRPPFTAPNPKDLLNKHLKSPVPALKPKDGEISPDFAAAVKRLLAKDPAARPQSMHEVQQLLSGTSMFVS